MSRSQDPSDESITIVKSSTRETHTRNSKLNYQIGTLWDDKVYFRIHKKCGNGYFCRERVALADIHAGRPVTTISLSVLFTGKSVNTPGFPLAMHVHGNLPVPMQGKKWIHEAVVAGEFMEKVRRLVSAKGKPKAACRNTAIHCQTCP
jgi:hypothetical protein